MIKSQKYKKEIASKFYNAGITNTDLGREYHISGHTVKKIIVEQSSLKQYEQHIKSHKKKKYCISDINRPQKQDEISQAIINAKTKIYPHKRQYICQGCWSECEGRRCPKCVTSTVKLMDVIINSVDEFLTK